MSKDNGGPAFPATQWTKDGDFLGENQGMTLRDYFAAKAIQGLLAQSGGSAWASDPNFGARWAYMMADAMLAERSKQ